MKFVDLTGRLFGRLKAIERVEDSKNGDLRWKCLCECGTYKIVRGGHLKRNKIKSCGCLQKETRIKNGKAVLTKHGYFGTKIYETWAGMIQRCNDPNSPAYKNYGGRGIQVCERWLKFENFLKDVGEKPTNKSLDRIDNDGNYCLENHRWATRKEQERNKRTNHLITHNGKTQCLSAWAEEYNLSYHTLWSRIKNDWPIEKALTTPSRRTNKKQ